MTAQKTYKCWKISRGVALTAPKKVTDKLYLRDVDYMGRIIYTPIEIKYDN